MSNHCFSPDHEMDYVPCLHPELKKFLQDVYASSWRDITTLSIEEARNQFNKYAEMRKFPKPLQNLDTSDYCISREDNQHISLRVYQPKISEVDAVIIFYHGGGYVLSSMQHYDVFCRWLCSELGVTVVSVDYRLAPEHPFPTPIEDGYFALEWIVSEAEKLLIKDKRIIVAGDSAGAHLAAMVSILSRDRAGPKIAWQWLIYPWLDNDFTHPSYQAYATGYLNETATMKWFDKHFMPNNVKAAFSGYPSQTKDLRNLPPAYIVSAEHDPLRDEAYVYSKKLEVADNVVHYECALGMIHGFLNQYSLSVSFNSTMKIFGKFRSILCSD